MKKIFAIVMAVILFSGCMDQNEHAESPVNLNSDNSNKKFKIAIFNSTITGAFTFPHDNITDALDAGSYYSSMFSHTGQVKALGAWMSAYGLTYDELNESQIEEGSLLDGTYPNYPILIVPYVSIASSQTEASLLDYMKHGGTVLNFGLTGKYDINVKPLYYQTNKGTGAVIGLYRRSGVAQTFKATDTNISVVALSKISFFGNPPDLVVNLTGTKLVSGLYTPDESNILRSIKIPKKLISTGSNISIKTIALTPLIVEFNYSNLSIGKVYAIVINGNSTGTASLNNTYYIYTSPKGGSTWGKSFKDGEEFVRYTNSNKWRNSTFANGYLSNLVIGIFNGTLRQQPLIFSSTGLKLNDNQSLLSSGMVVHPYYGYYYGPDGMDTIMNMTVVNSTDPLSDSFESQNSSILFRVHHMYNISGGNNTILSVILRQGTPKLMGFDSNKELPLLIQSNYGKGRFIEVAVMKDFNSMNMRSYLFTLILRNGIKSSFHNLNTPLIYKTWYPIGYQTAFAGLRMDNDRFNNNINAYFDNILRNTVYFGHRLYNYGATQWSDKYGNTYNQTLLNIINNGSVVGMHYDLIHKGADDIGTNEFNQDWSNYWNIIDNMTEGNYSSNGYNNKNYISPGFKSLRYINVQNLFDKNVKFLGDTALIPFPHRYISFYSYGDVSHSDTNYSTIPLIEYPLSVYYNKTLKIGSLNWDIKTYDETNTSIKWNYDNGFLINFYTHGADSGSVKNVQTYYQVLANYSGIWFTDFDNMTQYINNRYNFSFVPSYSNNLILLSLSGTNFGLSNITILNSTQLFDNGTVYIYPTYSIISVNISQFSQTKQINATITPSSDYVTVTMVTWNSRGDYRKIWNEISANPAVVTTHVIGDFPSNADIQIKRDGIAYFSDKTNLTGYLTFVHNGSYSEHTFEATLINESI
jgi:hypothetical protein